MSDTSTPSAAPAAPSRRRWLFAGAGLFAALGALFTANRVRAGWGGHHHWHGAVDPESAGKRAEGMVNWVLSEVDATPEQKARVSAIARETVRDLMPLREQHRAARREAAALLSAQAIDRDALEGLRAEQLARADEASRRIVQAMADAAEVLDPGQRARLAEHYMRMRHG